MPAKTRLYVIMCGIDLARVARDAGRRVWRFVTLKSRRHQRALTVLMHAKHILWCRFFDEGTKEQDGEALDIVQSALMKVYAA